MTETGRTAPKPQAPNAPKHPTTRTHHGRVFVDDYEWLRDKEAAETIAYLEAENAYTDEVTKDQQQLQEDIFQEIKSRVKETDMSVPSRDGDYWYYGRTEEGKSYFLSCRLPVLPDQDPWTPPVIPENSAPEGEEIILDGNVLAEGHEFFSLGGSGVTQSGRFLAYSTDTTGDERYTLRIKDLATGELLEDTIEGISSGLTWCGEEYLFYQRVDDAWRPDSVWRHKVGTPVTDDVRVFYEPDERFWVGVSSDRMEKFLYIESGSKLSSEIWVLECDNPTGEFRCLRTREAEVEYDVTYAEVGGEPRWLVLHNAHGPNFELGECPLGPLPDDLDDLRVLVPHRDTVRLNAVGAWARYLVLSYRQEGASKLAVMQLGEQGFTEFKELEFDEELYDVGFGTGHYWDAPCFRLSYDSFTTPARLYDYWPATGELRLLKEQEIPGGYNRDDYVAHRLWVTAQDGAQVPVSVIHRADLDMSVPNPTLLYGYGSYESTIDPSMSILWLSLLDRGIIVAVAHVRGGGEMGRLWYDNGKMLTKKNTFTDFIDVADYLISSNMTTPELLVAQGGSAGGLLMGAVANMGGDRFKAIHAAVPFVDPLTSILMPELPLTVIEWEEWGNPLEDVAVYDYMASYSPYENVEAKPYPNILASTSLNDTRVLYVEPAKWVAKLRDMATSGDFLLKTEMSAGHGGVSGRYESWKQAAFEHAWIIDQLRGGTPA